MTLAVPTVHTPSAERLACIQKDQAIAELSKAYDAFNFSMKLTRFERNGGMLGVLAKANAAGIRPEVIDPYYLVKFPNYADIENAPAKMQGAL